MMIYETVLEMVYSSSPVLLLQEPKIQINRYQGWSYSLLAGILWMVIQTTAVSCNKQKARRWKRELHTLSVVNTKNPPSRPITDREAVWKLIIPATLSLARIITVTVSKLGRIRLPPSVWMRLIMILSLSSGSTSSKMVSVTIFFVSPTKRRTYMYLCVLIEITFKKT